MPRMKLALSALTICLSLAGLSGNAEARRDRRAYDDAVDTVVAESRFGNGSVQGAVRMTELGPQVQLPGGRWEYCRRSCSETLRVETIDFNENHAQHIGGGGIGNECGIFGCLDIGIGRRRGY